MSKEHLMKRFLPVAIVVMIGVTCISFVSCAGPYYDELNNNVAHWQSTEQIGEMGPTLQCVYSNDVLARAYQMANVIWTPIKPIPLRDGYTYSAGQMVKGIPYSAVAEINTYLFQDVSYHTFMTAVHNPNSVLYTENISHEPYHGKICSPYYGAVCSSSVMWALDIPIPYYADQIIHLPYMEKNECQSIDSLKVCDIIWRPGHVQMVYSIEKDTNCLSRIKLFESSGRSAHIKDYSRESFEKLWNTGGYVGYRYQLLRYSKEPFIPHLFEAIEYNDDLCPSKGDRSVYRDDDSVVISIFNEEYKKIVLKNGKNEILATDLIRSGTYTYNNLPPGVYYVYLQNASIESRPISFEIIKLDVSVSNIGNNQLLVSFSSSSTPEYVALCTIDGISNCFIISERDKKKESIIVPQQNMPEYYCKVVFKGEYGRIINRPIRVR